MVRTHHHDSSQLSAALFGGGDAQFQPPKTQFSQQDPVRRHSDGPRFSKEERRTQWENNHTSLTNNPFYVNDGSQKVPTPPTDKPPDIQYNYAQIQTPQSAPPFPDQNYSQHPFGGPQQSEFFPYMKQSLQPGTQHNVNLQQSSNQQFAPQSAQQQQFSPQMAQQQFLQQNHQQLNLQLPQQQMFMQQQNAMQQQQLTPNHLVPPMTNGGMFLATPPTSAPQYIPVQLPAGTPGFGNGGPVYLMMPPQMPLESSRRISTSAPNVNEMMIQSLSSASSLGSSTRWSAGSPDPQLSNPSTGSLSGGLSRAKWGEKGVGVGRLWDPEAKEDGEPNGGGRQLPAPQWANKDDLLPGSQRASGERTHTRGQVIMDSQEMAEKQRRQRQAQETQRIIQQQLEEKKRIQAEEEERDRREAEMWEEKMRKQQEKERKEMEEEVKKKKEKEEAEERRQQHMRKAILDAAERAKKEKEEAKYSRAQKLMQSSPSKIPQEPVRPQTSTPKKASVTFMLGQDESKDSPLNSHRSVVIEAENAAKEEPSPPPPPPAVEEVVEPKPKINLPDVVSTAQVGNLDQAQKLALLTALGINPDYLLSSGVFDKSTFMALLGPGQDQTNDDSGQYVRNVMLTPTKFRKARDFGVQCDQQMPEIIKGHGDRKPTRRRMVRRQKPIESENSSSSEKPQWGRHKSDRPYRKQSEKDPYAGRRFRKKHTRSMSVSDAKDSHTDPESDNQLIAEPRRRKTWGESMQESMSSDFSRSPSPRPFRPGIPNINLPRGPPPIKLPLTPNLQQERVIDSPNSALLSPPPIGRPRTADPPIKTPPERKTPDDPRRHGSHDDDRDVVVAKPQFRSCSPPVPALAGSSTFDIPEYPPGMDPPPVVNLPLNPRKRIPLKSSSKLRRKSSKPRRLAQTFSASSDPTAEPSPPVSPTEKRRTSLPDITKTDEEVSSDPQESKDEPTPSVEMNPVMATERPKKINSLTRPSSSSSCSRPMTARRLPPVEGVQEPVRPASAATITSRSYETLSLAALTLNVDDQITPVEVSPKISSSALKSISPSPPSLSAAISPLPFPLRKKKDSADSGFSGELSRPSSANSSNSNIEEQLGGSISSSGYEYLKKELAKDPDNIDNLKINPEKWIVLRSISNVRENFWRKNQDLSLQATGTSDSTL